MIFKTMQLDDSLANSCFNFNGTKYGRVNRCGIKYGDYKTYKPGVQSKCMECIIHYSDIMIRSNCSKDFECATLIFHSNTMFERVFRKYRDAIRDLLPTKLEILSAPTLGIIVNSYNITKITYEYINSTVNMDAPNASIYITFKKHSEGLAPLTVQYDWYLIKFRFLSINVQCQDGNSWANYQVSTATSNLGRLFPESECAEFTPTKPVGSYKYCYVD